MRQTLLIVWLLSATAAQAQTPARVDFRTDVRPVQAYFESGFPHGKDQFISAAATNWATMALIPAAQR